MLRADMKIPNLYASRNNIIKLNDIAGEHNTAPTFNTVNLAPAQTLLYFQRLCCLEQVSC
ncbi:MAG: hypothetical protein C0401_05225 [Anaerolinea sp.]|nr:hypothetical protein [Anaerolinea sp.]